jgi:hypothetical protein
MNAGMARRAGHAVEAERPQQRVLVVHRPDVHLWDEQHDVRVSRRSLALALWTDPDARSVLVSQFPVAR